MSDIQEFLDHSARLSNELWEVNEAIKEMRGKNPPPCWGHDDCSTLALMVCPWRIDCGDK